MPLTQRKRHGYDYVTNDVRARANTPCSDSSYDRYDRYVDDVIKNYEVSDDDNLKCDVTTGKVKGSNRRSSTSSDSTTATTAARTTSVDKVETCEVWRGYGDKMYFDPLNINSKMKILKKASLLAPSSSFKGDEFYPNFEHRRSSTLKDRMTSPTIKGKEDSPAGWFTNVTWKLKARSTATATQISDNPTTKVTS